MKNAVQEARPIAQHGRRDASNSNSDCPSVFLWHAIRHCQKAAHAQARGDYDRAAKETRGALYFIQEAQKFETPGEAEEG